MCGIVGFLGTASSGEAALGALAEKMSTCLAHRGPDDSGVWVDEGAGLALGFRRLSILDLSPAGHQPMVSHCGRYVITFNGEIYNYLDIRDGAGGRRVGRMEGPFRYRGNSRGNRARGE